MGSNNGRSDRKVKMANLTQNTVKELALALLDTDHGVSENVWWLLYDILHDHDLHDIIEKVEACEGKWFLSKN